MALDFAEWINWACLLLLAGIGVWFAAAVGHFNKQSPRRPLLVLLQGLWLAAGLATVRAVATNHRVPPLRSLAAAAAATLAAVLFRAALCATRNKSLSVAFSRTTAPALVQSGPYRYIRHPLYTSYVIFWISCAFASGTSLVAILVTA